MATTTVTHAPTRPTCPAGGPGCDSRTRELHVHNGPMGGEGRLPHLPALRLGERALHRPHGGQVNAATSFTDQLGRPITVGARVVPVDGLGAVLWSRSGQVTGLGRTLVHVRWSRERYDHKRRHHAVRGERLRIREA